MKAVRRLVSWLVYGGSGALRDYERSVLDHLGKSQGAEDLRALEMQLAELDHVKRLHQDRMVTFYFDKPEALPRLSNGGLEHKLAAFGVSTGRRRLRVTLVSHRGLLSSLEFSTSPTHLEGKPLSFSSVRETYEGRDIAREIDDIEHAGGSEK